LCPACHRRKTNRERVERSAVDSVSQNRVGSVNPVVE
jgi:hypothetical protein